MNEDEKWMQIAIQEAIKAEKEGEVPVGAILVKDGLLIAKAHNQPISKNVSQMNLNEIIEHAIKNWTMAKISSLNSIDIF